MKKILCIILSLLIIFSTFATVGIVSFGVSDNVSLSTFVSDAKEMIDEYGLYVETKSDSFQTYSEENESEFKTRRLIIKSDSDIDTLNAISVVSGFRNLWVLQFETEEDTATAYEYYCSLDSIEFVEADSVVTTFDAETVATTDSQKNYLSWGPKHIGFDELNEIINENNIKLETVYVAVIDTGVDYNHEFLKNRVEKTTFNSSDTGQTNDPLDDDDHGTHVAGIIADCTLDNVIIRPYKCLNSKGEGTDLTISAGIYQAADDENDVINMSFGSTGESPLVEDALSYAKEKSDPVMVAAMGNDGAGNPSAIPLPAKSPLVIGVSSIDENNEKPISSNFGKEYTELAAPGEMINSTIRNNGQKEKSGTSMAAPFVSAVAAYARGLYPSYASEQIRSLMNETAIPLTGDKECQGLFGNGLIYAGGILRDLSNSQSDVACVAVPAFSVDDSEVYSSSVSVEITAEDDTEIYYTTDGKIPSQDSIRYDGTPISIEETTMVLAVAYSEGKVKSNVSVAHYKITIIMTLNDIGVDSEGYITLIKNTKGFEYIEIPEVCYGKNINGQVFQKEPIGVASDAVQYHRTLKYVKFPDTVKIIKSRAFYSSHTLQTVIADGVETVGSEAFYGCKDLINCSFKNAKTLGYRSFSGAGKNASMPFGYYFPNVTTVGENCFSSSGISFINIPEATEISDRAFGYCFNLSNVMLPSACEIGNYAFEECTSLRELTLQNARNIGEGAFSGCNVLNSVYFPEARSLGNLMFINCSALNTVSAPNVREMYINSFNKYAPNITELNFPSLETLHESEDDDVSSQGLPRYLESFIAPNLKNIPDYTFYSCRNLKYVEFPSVETIGSGVFINCEIPDMYWVDFRNLISAQSLPNSTRVLLSSRFTTGPSYKPKNLVIYGISGTYAEQFAKENKCRFVSLPYFGRLPDTATEEDTISINAQGINTQYQWYGASSPKYRSGVAIEGATEKDFVISEHKRYNYYFCEITVDDNNSEPVSKYTTICENKSYIYVPPTSNGKITIATPSTRYLKYGESVNLYANATGLPEGAKIKWRIVDGSGVTLEPSVSGAICTVTSKSNGNVTIEAYAVNKNGNTLVNEKSNRIYDQEGINSEVSLWWIILYYIRQMFGITKTAINSLL